MSGLYNFYQTRNLLCKTTNNTIKTDFFNNTFTPESILKKEKLSIDKLNIDSIYDPHSDPIIIKIDEIYNDFLISKDVDKFINELYKIKSNLSSKNNIKSNIKKIIRLNNKNSNIIILNPLYESPIINKNIITISNEFINNKNLNNLQIDILSQGKFINLSYPSLGIIKSILTIDHTSGGLSYQTLLEFFNDIFKNIHINFEESFKLPIQNLNIGKTICNILTNNTADSIISVKDYINTVDINMMNIMTYEEIGKKKTKYFLKTQYIIPYELNKSNTIEYISNSGIKKYIKNYNNYFKSEKDLFNKIYQDYITPEANKKLLQKNHKVMYLLCYRNIILFYDFYHDYINNKINKHIISLKLSTNNLYKKLNYDEYFKYINKLNQSLLILKTILLNNLYNIFKPNIIGKNYGISFHGRIMYINENVIFTGNNIFDNIFFDQDLSGKDKNYNLFVNFNEEDYYDKNYKLFIGVSYDNNNKLNSSLGILNTNYTKLKSYSDYNNKILNLIIKIFKTCIPIELLGQLIDKKSYFRNSALSNKDKNNIKNYIITLFKDSLKKSTEYLIQIKNNNKKTKILILKSKINYNISYFIYRIVESSMYDITLKNEIRNEINKIKESYLDIIKKKLK
jgi:hypothetical protein